MTRIHFANLKPDRQLNDLAKAVIGPQPLAIGAQSVDLNSADVIVYPHLYYDSPETESVARLAKEKQLPCLFFRDTNDDVTPGNPSYGTLYRSSILGERRTPAERGYPAFVSDLLANPAYAEVGPRPKSPTPSIGFCGYVGRASQRLLFRLQGRRQKVLGLSLRNKALRALERSPGIQCNFIRRDEFWGGVFKRQADAKAHGERVRSEFLHNLFNSDYALCLRGAGNFSYRFYEVMSVGRIPLFINTACVLPFEDEVDWKKYCVWVEEADLPRAGEILAEFHRKLTDDDFQQLQHDVRTFWLDSLRIEPYFERILKDAVRKGAGNGRPS